MIDGRAARAWALLAAAGLGGCRPETRTPEVTTAVKLDHFGYRPGDLKVAVLTADPGATVEVRTLDGQPAFVVPRDGGSIVRKGRDAASGDDVWWVDFSPFGRTGHYQLWSARLDAVSYAFEIGLEVYVPEVRAALRTFYLQRCGTAKPPAHASVWADEAACHRSDAAAAPARGQHPRGRRDLAGGWHDAGDYNKYLWYAASNAVLFLLAAWERAPELFPDGQLGVPESANGVSDLLDEVKWELDFFLKMQLEDGSVLSQVHADGTDNGASPPSADATVRYYHDPTVESGSVFAGSCAVGARVFAAAGQASYAAALGRAAARAWAWLEGQGDRDEKVWAAAELFRADPALSSARRYVDGYRPDGWARAEFAVGATSYDVHAALAYVQAPGATPAVASAMRTALGRRVDRLFAGNDLYRNGMPPESFHWGSNAIRAADGVFLLDAARLGVTGSHTAEECRAHALDLLHFFHGQNPLSMVYLTNMAALGGEHSSWQIFHNWFGQSGNRHSRLNYVGKPSGVAEPGYPYFPGMDNHGVRDGKVSAWGPPPGFVPGGPNRRYTGDARPPAGAAYPNRFYRDWNDQAAWTARTWEITENSIGYQGPYVALVAAFAAGRREGSGVP